MVWKHKGFRGAMVGFFFICCINQSAAQGLRLDWVSQVYGGHAAVRGLAVDNLGNVFTAGAFNDVCWFGKKDWVFKGQSQGESDMFVQKTDRDGTPLWKYSTGGTTMDAALSIAVDTTGAIYVAGVFSGTVEFDNRRTKTHKLSSLGKAGFLLKLGNDGFFRWVRPFGLNARSVVNAISIDNNNDVIVTGSFQRQGDFNSDLNDTLLFIPKGGSDVFVAKLDEKGRFLWGNTFGGRAVDEVSSIAIDSKNSILLSGPFKGATDLDPGNDSFVLDFGTGQFGYLSKLTKDGDFLWAKGYGHQRSCYAEACAVDAYDNIYLSGSFWGEVDCNPGGIGGTEVSEGNGDIFLFKTKADGSFLWSRSFGGKANSDFLRGIAVSRDGNICLTGTYSGPVDFDPGPDTYWVDPMSNWYSQDAFVASFSKDGDFYWASGLGGQSYDNGHDCVIDDDGIFYVSGDFRDTADLDPSRAKGLYYASTQDNDVFVLKLDSCTSVLSTKDSLFACESVRWQDGNDYRYSTNLPFVKLKGYWGCDSLVYLDLTIGSLNKNIEIRNDTLFSREDSATYSWFNCDDNAKLEDNQLQCFKPKGPGNYAVLIQKGECLDTSDCLSYILTSSPFQYQPIEMSLYPNPTREEVFVEWKKSVQFSSIAIYNSLGKLLSLYPNQEPGALDVSGFNEGLYFVELREGAETKRKPMIISR